MLQGDDRVVWLNGWSLAAIVGSLGAPMNDLSPYLPVIMMACAAFLLGIASPGPSVLAVIGSSISIGRTSGIALAVGVAAGSLCWEVLTVLGLSALLSAYATALIVNKIGGLLARH